MGSGNSTPSTCTSCADSALSITGNIVGILTFAYALLAGVWVYSSSQARAWTDCLNDLSRRLTNTLQFILVTVASTSLIRRAYDGDLKDLLADGAAYECSACYEAILNHMQEFWRSLHEVGLVDSTSAESFSKLDQPGASEHITRSIHEAFLALVNGSLGLTGGFKQRPKTTLWHGILSLYMPDFSGWRIRARYLLLQKEFDQHLALQERLKAQVLVVEQKIQMSMQEKHYEKLQNLERICQNIARDLALLKRNSDTDTTTEP